MIKRLIDSWYITSAQARAIETFMVSLCISLCIWVVENAVLILQWKWLSRQWFFIWFIITSSSAITMGLRKYQRDLINKDLEPKLP